MGVLMKPSSTYAIRLFRKSSMLETIILIHRGYDFLQFQQQQLGMRFA